MANHTTNLVRFGGPSLEALEPIKVALRGEPFEDGTLRLLDFNKLIAMPPILSRVVSPVRMGENGRVMLIMEGTKTMESREATPEEHAEFLATQKSAPPSGFGLSDQGISWYEWASHHWGTKWNAYSLSDKWTEGGPIHDYSAEHRGWRTPDGKEPEIYYIQLKFQTAWSHPAPIIAKLAQLAKQHGLTFDHWFSDEDGGSRFDPESNDWVTIYEHNIVSDVDWS